MGNFGGIKCCSRLQVVHGFFWWAIVRVGIYFFNVKAQGLDGRKHFLNFFSMAPLA